MVLSGILPSSNRMSIENLFLNRPPNFCRHSNWMLNSRGSDSLMSLANPSDGRGRSGLGETQARPNLTGQMTAKHALLPNLNENRPIDCDWETMKSYTLQSYNIYLIMAHDQTLYANSVSNSLVILTTKSAQKHLNRVYHFCLNVWMMIISVLKCSHYELLGRTLSWNLHHIFVRTHGQSVCDSLISIIQPKLIFMTLMAIILVCKSSLSGYALIDKLCHIDGKPDDHSLYACSLMIWMLL